jgi:hypothetical protein
MLAVLSTLALGSGEVLGAGRTIAGSTEGALSVQRIEVHVVRSTPPRVFVRVHGVLLNGCTTVGTIQQRRDAQVITVTIPTHTTAEVCTMMARLVDEKVRLEGEFTSGSVYTVNVNGVIENFSL